VTIGATASFRTLIDAVTSKEFLKTLNHLEYSHLTIQCGPDLEYVKDSKLPEDQLEELMKEYKLDVKLFDFNRFGLGEEMKGCKSNRNRSREGIVVSHAGKSLLVLTVFVLVILEPKRLTENRSRNYSRCDENRRANYSSA
jgi:beta-1,4-N-acetylglucosaminyltransferase